MQQCLRHLQKAFANFWGKRAKYPRFKKKRNGGSAEFTKSAFKFQDGQVWLAKCKDPLNIVWSRYLPEGCQPSTITVKLEPSGRWFVSLLVDDVTIKPLPPTDKQVGIDAGVSSLITTSDGEKITNPKHFNRLYRKLKVAQKELSRKTKGSSNREGARLKVAKIHAKIKDARTDFLHKLLTGLNFRQISVLIDKDELVVAKILYPSIVNRTIVVRNPKSPFEQLAKIPKTLVFGDVIEELSLSGSLEIDDFKSNYSNSNSKETIQLLEKNWEIACIDDSLTVHNQIKKFLDENMFSVSLINAPMGALAALIEFEPDLILLDIDLPNINGYELCQLLRNNHDLKNIPVILLTENNQSLINMTKSKLVGATDYLSKPFTQSSLFNIIFKYLP